MSQISQEKDVKASLLVKFGEKASKVKEETEKQLQFTIRSSFILQTFGRLMDYESYEHLVAELKSYPPYMQANPHILPCKWDFKTAKKFIESNVKGISINTDEPVELTPKQRNWVLSRIVDSMDDIFKDFPYDTQPISELNLVGKVVNDQLFNQALGHLQKNNYPVEKRHKYSDTWIFLYSKVPVNDFCEVIIVTDYNRVEQRLMAELTSFKRTDLRLDDVIIIGNSLAASGELPVQFRSLIVEPENKDEKPCIFRTPSKKKTAVSTVLSSGKCMQLAKYAGRPIEPSQVPFVVGILKELTLYLESLLD